MRKKILEKFCETLFFLFAMEPGKDIPCTIHHVIRVPDWMLPVLDSPHFQSMRWKKQTGLCLLVWPSANHTRYEHSIGTMYLARKYHNVLGLNLSKLYYRAFLLAALLHDIGHCAFSHLFEFSVKGFNHDEYRHKILDELTKQKRINHDVANHVHSIWRGHTKHGMFKILNELIEGDTGVDRMDYILRDSSRCNPAHQLNPTCIDFIMNGTSIFENSNETFLQYTRRAEQLRQELLHARSFLYANVYNHRVVLASDLVIAKALRSIPDEIAKHLEDVTLFPKLTDDAVMQFCNISGFIYERKIPKFLRKEKSQPDSPRIEPSGDACNVNGTRYVFQHDYRTPTKPLCCNN